MADAPDYDEVETRDLEPASAPGKPPLGGLRRRGIYLLPNLFTTGVLFCGFFAIVQAKNGRFETDCIAIFVAMVLDGMDGRVARWTNTQSEFGAQFDSIADMVAFGPLAGAVPPLLLLRDLRLRHVGDGPPRAPGASRRIIGNKTGTDHDFRQGMQFSTMPKCDHQLVTLRPIVAADLPVWHSYLS